MSADPEFERILDVWLLEGPTEVPDRVLDAVLDRLERPTDRSARAPFGRDWRPRWHQTAFAAAAVAAVLVIGIGLGFFGPFLGLHISGSQPTPSARPSQAATPSPSEGRSPSPAATAAVTPAPTFACLTNDTPCLGVLAAGIHSSANAGFSYTVPAGWENTFDRDGAYLISEQGATDLLDGIALFRDPSIDNECTSKREPALGRSVDDLVRHLTTNAALVATSPTSISIGGRPGKTFELTSLPQWATRCADVGNGGGQYLVDSGALSFGWSWGIGPGEHQRLYFLDAGNEGVIAIAVNTLAGSAFDQLAAAANPIVNGFTFDPAWRLPRAAPSTSP